MCFNFVFIRGFGFSKYCLIMGEMVWSLWGRIVCFVVDWYIDDYKMELFCLGFRRIILLYSFFLG